MAGFFIGGIIGGPFVVIAPVVGFVLGLVGDMKLLGRNRKGKGTCHG